MLGARPTTAAAIAATWLAMMSASCSSDTRFGHHGVMGNAVFTWSCVDPGDCDPDDPSVAVGGRVDISARLSSNVPDEIFSPAIELHDPDGVLSGFEGQVIGRVAVLAVTSHGVADFIWFHTHHRSDDDDDSDDSDSDDSSIELVYGCEPNDFVNQYGQRCGQPLATQWVAGDRILVTALPDDVEYTWRTTTPSQLRLSSPDDGVVTIDVLSEGQGVVVVESADDTLEQVLTIAPGPTRTRPGEDTDSTGDTGTTGDTDPTGDASDTGMESGSSGGTR